MPKVRIVTDSTSDIPPQLAAENEIEVLPLTVTIDHQEYKDGADINPSQFYALQAACKELPQTAPITLTQFQERFERLVRDGSHVIAIHLSSGLSGTVAAAGLAGRCKRTRFLWWIPSSSVGARPFWPWRPPSWLGPAWL